MLLIPTKDNANSSFSIVENDNSYLLEFRKTESCVLVTITINDDQLPTVPAVTGQLLIPYPRLEVDGNFIIDCDASAEIDTEQFGITQNLYYLTADESTEFKSNYYGQ